MRTGGLAARVIDRLMSIFRTDAVVTQRSSDEDSPSGVWRGCPSIQERYESLWSQQSFDIVNQYAENVDVAGDNATAQLVAPVDFREPYFELQIYPPPQPYLEAEWLLVKDRGMWSIRETAYVERDFPPTALPLGEERE